MKTTGKRRVEGQAPKKFNKVWLKMWDKVYSTVSVCTYIMAIVSLIATIYYVYTDFEPLKALSTGLLVLLLAKMNQLNP